MHMHMNVHMNSVNAFGDGQSIPINVKTLLEDTIVETNRIEYKESWNPEKIAHTMCAFANDYENVDGGYIIVGVREKDGVPIGFNSQSTEDVVKIEKELQRISNLISPRYVPLISVDEYRGNRLVVIRAPRGESRPYKCPIGIGKSGSQGERAYYIRHLSSTVRANMEEEINLIRRSNKPSFDDMTNEEAKISDIKRVKVQDYLARIGSKLDFYNMDLLDIYKALRIVRGPPELVCPVNVGLMMFSSRPADFFEKAYTDVVFFEDESGTNMEEHRFDGSLDEQIMKALDLIKARCVAEKVIKVPYQAESIRFYSYPYEALEETLTNALYHRDYQIPEPVKVYVYKDRIEFFNRPGPDPSITEDRMQNFDFKCDCYLNGRIGDFFKELRLTEGRNTGILRVLNALRNNGSSDPKYETDAERRYLCVTIPIHEAFLPDEGEVVVDEKIGKYRDPEDTKTMIMASLRLHGCQTSKQLATSIGYSSVNNTFRRCLFELMDESKISYLYPNNPKDRRQKICLPKQ